MTPDQYRREGAQMLQKAAAMYAECAPDRIPYRDHAGGFDWREGLMDGARAAAEAIRAIDVGEVLARLPPASDAVARLWYAARLGLDMARANDLTNTAETIMEAMNAVECPCKGSDEMCPCQNRRPAPDAVARLVEAARAGLNYLENTEGEFGITLGSATGLRAALAAMEASHDRT